MDNTAFAGRTRLKTATERFFKQEAERKMQEIGPSGAADRRALKGEFEVERMSWIEIQELKPQAARFVG